MKLAVKNLNEVNQFMEAVKPLVLKADISKNNIKAVNEIGGEIVLGDEDSQIKIHVTDGDQSENKYNSITDSPDLPTKINNKPEDIGHSVDLTEQFKKLFAKELLTLVFLN